jgi:hypothetical protein
MADCFFVKEIEMRKSIKYFLALSALALPVFATNTVVEGGNAIIVYSRLTAPF